MIQYTDGPQIFFTPLSRKSFFPVFSDEASTPTLQVNDYTQAIMIHVRRWQRQSHTHTNNICINRKIIIVPCIIHILHSCTSLKTIQKIIVKILSWLNHRIRCMRNSFLNRHCK